MLRKHQIISCLKLRAKDGFKLEKNMILLQARYYNIIDTLSVRRDRPKPPNLLGCKLRANCHTAAPPVQMKINIPCSGNLSHSPREKSSKNVSLC